MVSIVKPLDNAGRPPGCSRCPVKGQGFLGFDRIHNTVPDMATDLRIPEGIVVRTAKGGPDSLKGILADLKQYSFTGYLKVTLEKPFMTSTGYIVVEQGTPMMAIYEFEKSKPRELRRIYTGEKSLRFILEDSQDKGSSRELHSRVPIEEFERRFPDARLSDATPPAKPPKEEGAAEAE